MSFLGSVVRIRVRLGKSRSRSTPSTTPAPPPPERGAPATVSFAREDLLVLEGAEAA